MTERFTAEYILHTHLLGPDTAAIVAGEQSSGTFVELPGESAELKERSAARVEHLERIDNPDALSLPGSQTGQDALHVFRMVLSWPIANIGPSLPNLLATVAGNLFELKQVAGLKLLDIKLPDMLADAYSGPGYGVDGTRRLTGVEDRPLIGTIIKPSIGLNPEETASLVDELCQGGIDFIKDDELQADGSACPFEDRYKAVAAVIERHADRTGSKVMYAANLTGDLDQMRRRHDLVERAGGICVMLSLNSVGMVGLTEFRKHCRLPIHAHRNGWGYLGRSPNNGWSYIAWQKLWRLAGVDHMHVNGIANKFWESDESVIASARECLTPMFSKLPCIVMPIFSSGQSVMQVHETWRRLKSPDLIYCAGGGIMAHPLGIAAGVRSLREAWDAAMAGVPLSEAAASSPDLKKAVEKFG